MVCYRNATAYSKVFQETGSAGIDAVSCHSLEEPEVFNLSTTERQGTLEASPVTRCQGKISSEKPLS